MRVLVISKDGECMSLAWQLVREGNEVQLFVQEDPSQGMGHMIVPRVPSWRPLLDWADLIYLDGDWHQYGDVFAGCAAHVLNDMSRLWDIRHIGPQPLEGSVGQKGFQTGMLSGLFDGGGWSQGAILTLRDHMGASSQLIPHDGKVASEVLTDRTEILKQRDYRGLYSLRVVSNNRDTYALDYLSYPTHDGMEAFMALSGRPITDILVDITNGELGSIEPEDTHVISLDVMSTQPNMTIPFTGGRQSSMFMPYHMYSRDQIFWSIPDKPIFAHAIGTGRNIPEALDSAQDVADSAFEVPFSIGQSLPQEREIQPDA